MTDSKQSKSDITMLPKEEMLEKKNNKTKLLIGIPKENQEFERRVPLTPQAVSLLVNQGHKVMIESEAGAGANYSDLEYSEAGGVVIKDKEFVFKSDIVVKVAPCTLDEIKVLKPNHTLISALHIATQKKEYITSLLDKKIKAIAYEYIRTNDDFHPVMYSMSEISGKTAVMAAAEYLSSQHEGKGVLLGAVTGITPVDVIILGSGTAAVHAAKAALGVGAVVKIFDKNVYQLTKFTQRLGQNIFTSILYPKVLNKALASADVVIGAKSIHDESSNSLITDDMVRKMKKSAVIIDLNVDTGSFFETSKPTTLHEPVFKKHDVIHYCVPNIASRVPRTSSIALSNVLTPLLSAVSNAGGVAHYLREDHGIRNGVYILNGILTNHKVGNKFNINAKDINLLMAAF